MPLCKYFLLVTSTWLLSERQEWPEVFETQVN